MAMLAYVASVIGIGSFCGFAEFMFREVDIVRSIELSLLWP